MLLNGNAPAALVFREREDILTAGVIVAKVLFERTIPVLVLNEEDFAKLIDVEEAFIQANDVYTTALESRMSSTTTALGRAQTVTLGPKDVSLLAGDFGQAAALAMKIVLSFAESQGATELVDISQSHLDSVLYTGPATLLFAERLLALGDARFAVPATMNSISIDIQRWQGHNVSEDFAEKANRLANAYIAMGAKPTFTCAPYLLDSAPSTGEQVAWAESNAVVFANSVLGARTQKYPDLIDVCIALTGRASLAGCHTDIGRLPVIAIRAPDPSTTGFDHDLFWPVLGYQLGEISGSNIPLVLGLETAQPTIPDLKAFGAAFATTSSASMFHIRGVTPEHVISRPYMKTFIISAADLQGCFRRLNSADDDSVDVVALGNPHFSLEEFKTLSDLVRNHEHRNKAGNGTRLMITASRFTYNKISDCGIADLLQNIGAELITDTCWCMIQATAIAKTSSSGNVMTNSAKYAHYAPGLVGRRVHFGSLRECVEAYFARRWNQHRPATLSES